MAMLRFYVTAALLIVASLLFRLDFYHLIALATLIEVIETREKISQ